MAMRKINAEGLHLIKFFEGLRLNAYYCPAGVLTIGYGHTGSDVHEGMTITAEQADAILQEDLIPVQATLTGELDRYNVNDNQFSALCSFTFNIGIADFLLSTMMKMIRDGAVYAASSQFERWVYVGKKVTPGLQARRAAERDLYLAPIDSVKRVG